MNAIALTNTDIKRAAFMVAKTNGNGRRFEKTIRHGRGRDFEYLNKSTGRIRRATGCLPRGGFIEARINGNGTPNEVYGNCTYWDLDRNAFRCFSYETLVRVL